MKKLKLFGKMSILSARDLKVTRARRGLTVGCTCISDYGSRSSTYYVNCKSIFNERVYLSPSSPKNVYQNNDYFSTMTIVPIILEEKLERVIR